MSREDMLYPPEFVAGLKPLKPSRMNSAVAAVCLSPAGGERPFRQQLETCFASLEPGDRQDMRPRLRATEEHTFWSAVHELFLWWLFRQRGCYVTHDPEVGGLTPDFLLTREPGDRLFVEVWTDTGPREASERDRNRTEIVAQINKRVLTPYAIGIDWQEPAPPIQKVDTNGLVGDIRDWVARLAPESAMATDLTIKDHGVHITLSAFPVEGPSRRERVWYQFCGAFLDDPRPRQHHTLIAKARKYRFVDHRPFALALCPGQGVRVDLEDLMSLCYGSMRFAVGTGGVGPVRRLPPDPDGLFSQLRDGGERCRTHVSALVYCKVRIGGNGAEMEVRVLHNPFALNPLPVDWFGDVAQFVARDGVLRWTHEDAQPLFPGQDAGVQS